MKKIVLLSFLLFTAVIYSQSKEKVKGSKIVKAEQKLVGDFESIEVEDNLEIFLIKGLACGVEVEADDNLIEFVDFKLIGPNLRISTTRDISSYKKLSVRVTYTELFNMVISKDETNITALSDIVLKDITFKCYDRSKLYLNAKSTDFTLMANDKSKVELNLKSVKSAIDLSNSAYLKALISTEEMIFDMYQKAEAEIEGDCNELKLRMDNNTDFKGKNFTVKNNALEIGSYSKCEINVGNNLTLKSIGNGEIILYGDPKIDIKSFKDNSLLRKK